MKKNKVIIHVIHSPDLASLIRNHSNFSIIQTKVIIRALKKFDLFVLFLYTMTFFTTSRQRILLDNRMISLEDVQSSLIRKFLTDVLVIMKNIGTAIPQKYSQNTSDIMTILCSAKSLSKSFCTISKNIDIVKDAMETHKMVSFTLSSDSLKA